MYSLRTRGNKGDERRAIEEFNGRPGACKLNCSSTLRRGRFDRILQHLGWEAKATKARMELISDEMLGDDREVRDPRSTS
mmetsp:Transcript_6062/g.19048  ORF Transcript_6062/g.19048 Transcript_6062/m.19048 type:complete len:80 (+) Transcript_6062:398-637(+)|eukprot:scaffold265269_cov30-Tisochrysis_lutea.AAC.1